VKVLGKNELYGLVRFGDVPVKHEGYSPFYSDLTDYHYLAKMIKEISPEVVIHLAALTSVSQSFDRPQQYMEANVLGTINLAEINLKHNLSLKRFIMAGTPEEYGVQQFFPIKETASLNPNSPYAVSKVAATKYLLYLNRAYGFPVVISRHANAFGRKTGIFSQLGVIENIITQMLKSSEVYVGKNVMRDFLYIDDVMNWYESLLKSDCVGEVYNAGWGASHSIEEVVNLIREYIHFKGQVHWNTLPTRPGEIPNMALDYSKAKKQLGWRPKVAFEQGIKLTIEYFSKA
jgi:nucleoside-diphosphate-sugar epimerase